MSPTARSLKYAREVLGWKAQVVEHWNAFAKVRVDLFGVIDIIAITPFGIMGIQATSGDNHAARRTKSLASNELRSWIEVGGHYEIWSWSKKGERGAAKHWALRRDPIAKSFFSYAA